MSKKYRKKKTLLSRYTAVWPVKWPLWVYLAANVIVVIIAVSAQTLEIKYLFSKLWYFSIGAPLILWLLIGSIFNSLGQIRSELWFIIILSICLVFVTIVAVMAFIDIFHSPLYITGKVEDVNYAETRSANKDMWLEGDSRIYHDYTFKIQVEEGISYKFRLMPVSGDLIAVEQID